MLTITGIINIHKQHSTATAGMDGRALRLSRVCFEPVTLLRMHRFHLFIPILLEEASPSLPAAFSLSGSVRNRDNCIQFLFNWGHPQTHRHNGYLNTHILSPSWCLFLLKSIVGRNSMWENVANFIQQVESTYVMQTFTAVSFSFSILQNFLCFPFFSARICSFITTALDEVILFQTGLIKSRCGHMEDRTYDPCPQGCQSYPKCMHSHMKMLTVTVAVGFIICQVVTFHIFTFHD